MRHRKRHGFTLIELLIVVVIIGILATIAIPKFANTKEKAYVAQMKSDLRNLVNSEEAFFSDSVRYTSTLGNLKWRQSTGVNTPTIITGSGFWSATVSHTLIPGMTCEIAINTPNTLLAGAGDGEPVCQ